MKPISWIKLDRLIVELTSRCALYSGKGWTQYLERSWDSDSHLLFYSEYQLHFSILLQNSFVYSAHVPEHGCTPSKLYFQTQGRLSLGPDSQILGQLIGLD